MEWIVGDIASVEVEWLRREVVIPVNNQKELVSIKISGVALANGEGFFDMYGLQRNLSEEKLFGSEVSYFQLEPVAAGTAFEVPIFGAVKTCRIVSAHIVPISNIIGNNANHIQLQLVRKSDNAVICTRTYLQDSNSMAYEVDSFGPVNQANAILDLSDSVSFKIVQEGSGLTLPQSILAIQWNLA